MKTVLVFGTFDVIHPGHQWFLRNAAKHGNRLVAVVSRDTFVREWKGTVPVKDEKARIEALESSGLVDQAVLADPEIRTYGVIRDIKPDVICLGHDQGALMDDLEAWIDRTAGNPPVIHRLPPWKRKIFSSSRRNRVLRGADGEYTSTTWILSMLMVIAMIIFGFSWVSGKRISSIAPPATLAFIRFALTAFCFLPLMIGKRLPDISKDRKTAGWLWATAAALVISAYNLLFFIGLESGPAGKGGLIVTTMNPLFTFLIVILTSQNRPGRSAIAGITVGIVGGLLLLEPWRYTLAELADSGNLAFLIAALAWSLLTLISRKAQSILGFRRFNLRLYAIATMLMIPFAYSETGGQIPTGMDLAFWGDMFFISAAVGAFGTGVYFMASSRLGAARRSALTYLVPVSALTFTAVILGEKPELVMIIGGLLAISAVLLINRSTQRKNQRQNTDH